MSTYNERYDEALSKAQWVAKTAGNGRTYLFKYAPHPERTGYLFAATDLETVHFEALTGTSVLTRLAQVVGREEGAEASDAVSQLGFDEGQARTDEALKQLAEMFDGDWAGTTVSAESDDYFDAVFAVAAPSFAWVFNMTEMRGRQPLAFIARHLLAPFSFLMAQDRGVDIPGDSSRPVDAVAAVVSDAGVARGLRRVTGAPPPASSRVTPALLKPTSTPSPARVKTPSRSPERTPVARPPTPPRASTAKAAPPILPPSSPTPAAKRQRAYDYAAGLLPSSEPVSPGPTTDTVPEHTSPVTAHRTAPSTRTTPPPSTPPRNLPPPTSDVPSSSLAEPPTSTLDPLIPTQKKKKKKKDKKEEEEAEEAEADKRRAEMKRRMAAGAGGRLGRRRV